MFCFLRHWGLLHLLPRYYPVVWISCVKLATQNIMQESMMPENRTVTCALEVFQGFLSPQRNDGDRPPGQYQRETKVASDISDIMSIGIKCALLTRIQKVSFPD